MCCMCLLVGSPKISVHMIGIGGWLHLALFCQSFGYWRQNMDIPVGPVKLIGTQIAPHLPEYVNQPLTG